MSRKRCSKIAFVHFNPIQQQLIIDIINGRYEPLFFNNAKEANLYFINQPVCVVVIFIDPMRDSVELCQSIRNMSQITWICAVSKTRVISDILECREAGFDDYITYPMDIKLFNKLLDEAFQRIMRWKGKNKPFRIKVS